jgi:hypothetical protein
MAYAASFKTVALSQNSLRPDEIQNQRAKANPETARNSDFLVAPLRFCIAGGQKTEFFISPFLFFGSFLLEGQKK